MALRHYVRYTLVDKSTLSPVVMEGGPSPVEVGRKPPMLPITATNLSDLIRNAAFWFGVTTEMLAEALDDGEFGDYKIVRHEIDVWDLTEAELDELDAMPPH